jgi:hypothetical protein
MACLSAWTRVPERGGGLVPVWPTVKTRISCRRRAGPVNGVGQATRQRLRAHAKVDDDRQLGCYGMPANTHSLGWGILNNASVAQTVRVTVFRR